MMKHTLSAALSVCTLILLGQSLSHASDIPSAEEVQRVTHYYYNLQGSGPVLTDYKLCTGIQREGQQRNTCTQEIDSSDLEPGRPFYLWMNFMVPKGDKGKILVQLNHDGVTRDTRVLSVAGSMRYRTWRKVKLLRPGEWELPIYFEDNKGIAEVDRITLNVAPLIDKREFSELSLNTHVTSPVLH